MPPTHASEWDRILSLRENRLLARSNDPLMLSLARQAAQACNVPIGLVSLMEEDGERFVACVGYQVDWIPRRDSICAYAILEADVLTIADASADSRFRHNPYVAGEPHVRFYVGAPIFDAQGLPLGSISAIDDHPQEASSRCVLAIRRLAEVASAVMQVRLLFAKTCDRSSNEGDTKASQARLDAILLTLVESRPTSG